MYSFEFNVLVSLGLWVWGVFLSTNGKDHELAAFCMVLASGGTFCKTSPRRVKTKHSGALFLTLKYKRYLWALKSPWP